MTYTSIMRFESTTNVLAKCMPKNSRLSQCKGMSSTCAHLCGGSQVDASARQIELVMENGHDGKTSSEAALHAAEGQLVTGFIISVAGQPALHEITGRQSLQ